MLESQRVLIESRRQRQRQQRQLESSSSAQQQKSSTVFYQGRDPETGRDLVERDGQIVLVRVTGNAQPTVGMAMLILDTDSSDLPLVLGPSILDPRRRLTVFSRLREFFASVLFGIDTTERQWLDLYYASTSIDRQFSSFSDGVEPFQFDNNFGPFSTSATFEEGRMNGSWSFDFDRQDELGPNGLSVGQVLPVLIAARTTNKPAGNFSISFQVTASVQGAVFGNGSLISVSRVRLSYFVIEGTSLTGSESVDASKTIFEGQTPIAISETVNMFTPVEAGNYIFGVKLDALITSTTMSYEVNFSVSSSNLILQDIQLPAKTELWLGGDRSPILLKELENETPFGGGTVIFSSSGSDVTNDTTPFSGSIAGTVVGGSGEVGSTTASLTVDATSTVFSATGNNTSGDGRWASTFQAGLFVLEAGSYLITTDAVVVFNGGADVSGSFGVPGRSWGFDADDKFIAPNGRTVESLNISSSREISVSGFIRGNWPGDGPPISATWIANYSISVIRQSDFYLTAASSARFIFARDANNAFYFTVSGELITEAIYSPGSDIVTDPRDWRGTLASFDEPVDDPNPCNQAYRLNNFVNLQSGRLLTISSSFNSQLINGETIEDASITVQAATPNGSCQLGPFSNEAIETIEAIVPASETREVTIFAVVPGQGLKTVN